MDIFFYNLQWMTYNICLAIIPVLLGSLLTKMQKRPIKLLVLFAWLVFLPNTIYMTTDVNHLLEQWQFIHGIFKIFVLAQYVILMATAVITFIVALKPFERVFKKAARIKVFSMLIAINFVISFAVILGGIERVNSWDIIVNPAGVIQSVRVLFGSYQQVYLVAGFGVLYNIIYFAFRDVAFIFSHR